MLGRIRLSKDADESGTSIERQRESITQWSAMHGHSVVAWAIDSGVSGSVDPFDTPELGPWLKPERLPEWDALVAYRLDRLSRRVIPLNKLFGFVQEHGKTLASVSESLDLSTWIGRLVANVIAGVAEGELEAIRERNLGSHQKVRQLGRWHGGVAPYGYTAAKRADGWYLAVDDAEARVIREAILPRVLSHESTNSIAAALNRAEVPARRGGAWSGVAVRTLLRRRALLGQHEHNGKIVADEDGLPIKRADPVLTVQEFERVQEALQSRSVRLSARSVNPFAGIVFCYSCDAPLYPQGMKGRDYTYYRCRNRHQGATLDGRPPCSAPAVRSEVIAEAIEQHLLDEIGHLQRRERFYIAGSDHNEALADVADAISTTRREKDLGLYDGDDDEYFARLERLTQRRRELEVLPSTPAGFEWRDIGETYAQAWKRMDAAQRRTLLIDSGIKLTISGGPVLHAHLYFPEDIRGRIEGN